MKKKEFVEVSNYPVYYDDLATMMKKGIYLKSSL